MITTETVPITGSGVHNRWASLEHRSVVATAFSSEIYVAALADILAVPARVTFVVEDKVDIAGLITLVTKSGPLDRVLPAPLTPFSAFAAERLPAPASVHTHSSWMDAVAISLSRQYSTIDLMLPPSFQDVRAFQWNDWSASPLYTFDLPISDKESFLSQWSKSTLRLFRKEKDNFVLQSDRSDVPKVVHLCREGYARHGKNTPLSSAQMTGFAERMVDAGKAQCWSVSREDSDNISAGIILLRHDTTAVYWIAGSLPGPAMTVLIGLLNSELNDNGVTTLDFVGANTPAIAEFKRRFNPELSPYYRVRHTRSGFLKLVQSVTSVIRR